MAAALRDRLGLPLIAKDAIKETLGDALDVTGRAESHRLGIAVFQLLADLVHELLAAGVSLIAEGNFVADTALFRDLPDATIVQVHVSASPEVLAERLRRRDAHRHPVHYDAEAAEEIVARTAAGEWAALPIGGRLVTVDTTVWPDLDEVCALV